MLNVSEFSPASIKSVNPTLHFTPPAAHERVWPFFAGKAGAETDHGGVYLNRSGKVIFKP